LVEALSRKGIAQLWCDHAGHNAGRQYGSSTKSWRFDTVGILAPLEDAQRDPREVAFNLSFDYPGKARRRTPDNWQDFAPRKIMLRDNEWTATPAGETCGNTRRNKVSDTSLLFHRALLTVADPNGQATRQAWMAECVRRNLIDKGDPSDSGAVRGRKTQPFRQALMDLLKTGTVAADGDTFTDLTRGQK
jgi:hypothetical protein